MLTLRPEYHRSEYLHGRCPDGYHPSGPTISVDVADEGDGYLTIHLDPVSGDQLSDGRTTDVERWLNPTEARALAAVLVHYAGEIEANRC
jgi:hypothetical protein